MKNDSVWGLSLAVIGITVLILAGSAVTGIDLPDRLIRLAGAAGIIALPVLVFTTVRKTGKGK